MFTPSTKRPLVLYELNEVPWRVVDRYLARRPGAELRRILDHATTFTTNTRDEGELHPWSTWPSLHRGVYNTEHHLQFINQDQACAKAYPPIWETIAKAGRSVGVFGSLQSYPVPHDTRYAFYIPDTFSPSPETFPPRYEAFQRFNLRQTRADGAEAAAVQIDRSVVRDVLSFPRIGVRARTFAALAAQLAHERVQPAYRARRPLLQPVLAFDVFTDALRRYRPEFSTFFTNHVASVMHRYWKQLFPEDFDYELTTPHDRFHSENVMAAMDVADRQLASLRRYVEIAGGQLVIASSMGQEAIDRGAYEGELRVVDANALAACIGFDKPLRNVLAMHPDFNFEFDSEDDRAEFARKAQSLTTQTGECIWYRTREEGRTLNLSLGCDAEIVRSGSLYRVELDGSRTRIDALAAGIETLHRDVGTGYHQPRGILIWFDPECPGVDQRTEIELTAVRSMLLQALQVDPQTPVPSDARPSPTSQTETQAV